MEKINLGTGREWSRDHLEEPVWGAPTPAILPEAPRLRHTYIMAGTGSGKSELLKLLIHHEMSQKRAVIVVDAHTDICEQIARWPEFADSGRVVYVSPLLDLGRTAVFNPFEIPKGLPHSVKDEIAETLGAAVGEICSGVGSEVMTTRMESVVTDAVRIILELETPTFHDLYRALEKETPADIMEIGRRHWSPQIRKIFNTEWNSSDYVQSKSAIRVRLHRLLSMYAFRNMTCGKSTFSLYELAEKGCTVLFSLGGSGRTASKSLGKLIVCMATIVGALRYSIPENERKQTHVFLDECQNFVGSSTITVLEELRKFRILLTLANQNIERLKPEDIQTSILTNAGVLMMGMGDAPNSMLRRLHIKPEMMAEKLDTRMFLTQWGGQSTFKLLSRSDLYQRPDALGKLDWLELKARQRKKYYVPIVVEPIPDDGEADGWKDEEEVDLDLY